MKTKPQILLENFTIGYRSRTSENILLKNLTAQVNPGELLAVIGANGTGKSTLLKTLVDLQQPLAGRVFYNIEGELQHLKTIDRKTLARQMAYVSTATFTIPNMRVVDMVAFGRYPYTNWLTRLKNNDRQAIEQALDAVGLQGYAQHPIDEISDGERQRVVIAKALAQQTPVIILDEPTAFLDVENKYEIMVLLKQLAHEQHKTILLSSHDLNIVLQEADKIWMLHKKGIIEEAPEDLVLKKHINQLFQQPNLTFDLNLGDFRYQGAYRGEVRLLEGGVAGAWTQRALMRRGYRVTPESNTRIQIAYPGAYPVWTLTSQNGDKTECNSIYELLQHLKQLDQ